MERICVSGGAGFIGSHVTDALVAAGHEVVIIDDLSSGRKENVPDGATLEQLDIRSDAAAELMRNGGFAALFHLAAQMDVRRSVADPAFDADVNIGGLLNLVEAGRRGGLRQVVFSSTGGAIYGEQDVHPADEDHPARPVSPYGVSKLAGERYLYWYHHEYRLDAVCLRYANVYGPRQNPHGEAGVVAIFLDRLLEGRAPTIFGDGGQTRDFVFVEDVVDANLAALGRGGFEILNVGTGIETDVNELYGAIRGAIGSDLEAERGDARPGEQRRSSIDSTALERRLGVRPRVPVSEGIPRTARWFRRRAEGSTGS